MNRAGLEVAERFTSDEWRLWFLSAIVDDDFYAGAWDRAQSGAEAIMARPGARPIADNTLIGVLATIAAARGEQSVADAHLAALAARAREIGDPQVIHPALARAARLALDSGDAARAADYLGDSLVALLDSISNITPETIEAAIVAAAIDRGPELLSALAEAISQTPWAEASAEIVEGRFEEAGDILEAHGDLSHAALVRLAGAERAGHVTPGLQKAIAFYESVGAEASLARAAALTAV